MIIGLANSKGGVGKSTLARNLVVYLNDLGYPTALIDAEANAPTAVLLKSFDENLILRAASTLDAIDDAVQELSNAGFHVVLDAPGKEGDQVSTLCLLSDLVLIPLCVSEQDLLQTICVINLVRRQQQRSHGRKPDAAIVLTRTVTNDAAVPAVRQQLSRYGIKVAQAQVRELVAIKRNISVMRNALFRRQHGAASDFVALFDEVIQPGLVSHRRTANE